MKMEQNEIQGKSIEKFVKKEFTYIFVLIIREIIIHMNINNSSSRSYYSNSNNKLDKYNKDNKDNNLNIRIYN